MRPQHLPTFAIFGLCLLMTATGCQSMYYGSMELMGKHKRDLLVDRVEEARDSQVAAKEQFRDALEQFESVVEVDEPQLRQQYELLRKELQRSEERADRVHDRVDAVEDVAEALFREWDKELDDYSSADLRRASERQLRQTRERYEDLIHSMQRAEDKMAPVLATFRDHVLFLKHNLNARAVASIKGAAAELDQEIRQLITEMEASIDQANEFISQMSATAE